MKAYGAVAALLMVAASILPAAAQSSVRSHGGDELIGSYVAQIGSRDLVNSNGARLTQPWQVLRQDRANFHRYGIRDPGDEGDDFFANAQNRAAMESMVRSGSISRDAARDIMRGGATVLVEIYGSNNIGHSVQVTVAR